MDDDRRHLMVPAGTQVVTPSGAVGIIVWSPVDNTHAYRIRFADGQEVALQRREFSIRKLHQRDELDRPTGDFDDYVRYTIYRCVVGSQAYGLAHDASDVDRRGIYLPSADLQWALYGVPEQIEKKETEECYWELQKFLVLALKANPNVLECLHSPRVELATPLADKLRSIRRAFVSRLVYQTFNGYALSQFRRLEQDVRTAGQVRWKHAMHLVRLLMSGIETLRRGEVPVEVPADKRDALLDIRHGRMPWEAINAWRLDLHQQFEAAYAESRLPDRPDYDTANRFLLEARRSAL